MKNHDEKKTFYLELVNKIKKYHDEANESVWNDAYTLYKIIRDEDYKQEFTTRTEFAEYLNISKSTLSQYYRAVLFDLDYKFDKSVYSLGRVYLLSTLGSQFMAFKEYAAENGIDYVNASQKELRRIIKEYREYYESGLVKSTCDEKLESIDSKSMHRVFYKDKCILLYNFSFLKDYQKEEMYDTLREFLNQVTDLLIEPQLSMEAADIWDGNEGIKMIWNEILENEKKQNDDILSIPDVVDSKMKAILPPRKYEIWKSLKTKEEELFDKAYDINNLEKMLKFQNPDGSFSKYPVI